MPILTPIQWTIIGGLLAVVLTAGGIAYVFHKGENAGSSTVTTAVQTETIKTLDAARTTKERTDEKVRNTPLDVLVDGLK